MQLAAAAGRTHAGQVQLLLEGAAHPTTLHCCRPATLIYTSKMSRSACREHIRRCVVMLEAAVTSALRQQLVLSIVNCVLQPLRGQHIIPRLLQARPSPIAVPSTTSMTTTPSSPVIVLVAAAHTAKAPPMLCPTSSVGTRSVLLPNTCCQTATMS